MPNQPCKRPAWAKHRMYKVVDSSLRSDVPPVNRINDENRSPGKVLQYHLRTVIVSPNGVCRNHKHECCRGIHAYVSKDWAMRPGACIITVYAAKWYGSVGSKRRAEKVWVGSVVYG